MNLLRYQHMLKLQKMQNSGGGIDISTPLQNVISGVKDFGSDVVEGIKNWWYKNTGRAHLIPEYQYQQHLADTAYQRGAADMEAAGLSKYGGVNTASSPAPQSGNGLLSTALQMANLASGVQDLKERVWNYGVSKGLGIRTNDTNPLSGIASVFKLLTGKDLADYSDGDGIVGAIRDWWNGLSFNKGEGSPPSSDNPSNVLTSASADGVSQLLKTAGKSLEAPVLNSAIQKGFEDAGLDSKSVITEKSIQSLVEKANPDASFYSASSYVMKSLLADGKLTSGNLFSVAKMLSKKYSLSENFVLDHLFDLWDKYKETDEPGSLNFIKMR